MPLIPIFGIRTGRMAGHLAVQSAVLQFRQCMPRKSGMFTALADGSQRTVSKTIDKNVFKAVSTRNGALRGMVQGMDIENVTGTW